MRPYVFCYREQSPSGGTRWSFTLCLFGAPATCVHLNAKTHQSIPQAGGVQGNSKPVFVQSTPKLYSLFIIEQHYWFFLWLKLSVLAQFSSALWPPEEPPLSQRLSGSTHLGQRWNRADKAVRNTGGCVSVLYSVTYMLFCPSVLVQDYEIEYMEKIGSSSPVSISCQLLITLIHGFFMQYVIIKIQILTVFVQLCVSHSHYLRRSHLCTWSWTQYLTT